MQVSYRRAVDVLASSLVVSSTRPGYATTEGARRAAERMLRDALPDKQRARLDTPGAICDVSVTDRLVRQSPDNVE